MRLQREAAPASAFWNWFDPRDAEATWPSALETSLAYIDRHIDIAGKLGKPVVLSEFGLNRDDGGFDPETTTRYRDRFYETVFARLQQRAAAGDAIAGSNFWAWGGRGRTANADYMWQAGDAFTGDPPQEPQGLYSVFDDDATTLRIIGDHAAKMDALAD
ncbi:hypothetical protein [Luteimonas salinilitoris]|uniref:mannan endo-1,4-beta-mannosidase n=1 Tax=Luteimonas salinilitoris TaxID=3237697 RepID=A0ABV4HPM7_9GAMM